LSIFWPISALIIPTMYSFAKRKKKEEKKRRKEKKRGMKSN
jgi:hypothetical protein